MLLKVVMLAALMEPRTVVRKVVLKAEQLVARTVVQFPKHAANTKERGKRASSISRAILVTFAEDEASTHLH